MACRGGHCSYHNTGTTTCSGHRPSCATNRLLSLSADFGIDNGRIRASDAENLRANIRNELARWNLHVWYNFTLLEPTALSTSSQITNETVNNLWDMVRQVPPTNGDINVGDGALVDNVFWTQIRDKYNVFRDDCICNADCSCNAVCACHNDCGCNYSDQRVKTDICPL